MLNLIVVGNPDYHSFFSDNNGEASFPVSRLFESTPDSLRNKLLPLTSKTYQFLQELPVIFMTEPEFEVDEEDNTGGYYSHIRIGRISNIRAITINREKVLAFNYELTGIIGKEFLTSEKEYVRKLELGSFGLNRNFWAVKDIDVKEFFDILGLSVLAPEASASVKTEAPDNNEDLEVISDINQYLEIILNHPQGNNEEVFYRGHSDISYQLVLQP